MSPEDIALAFGALITLILALIPQVAAVVPPQYSVALLAIASLLKAVLGNLQKTKPVTSQPPTAVYEDVLTADGTVVKVQLTQLASILAVSPGARELFKYYDAQGNPL